jgi:hypothetical protein
MYLSLYRIVGIPIAQGLETVQDLPHTLTQAILYRAKLDSLNELPKDKRPPRNLWDKGFALEEYLEHIWDNDKNNKESKDYIEFDLEDVE